MPTQDTLTDEQILKVAKNPMTAPCSPWWLKDEVVLNDIRTAAKVFARAIEAAARAPLLERIAELEARVAELESAHKEVVGCFDAAEAEGLSGVLLETDDACIKDLVERRLMYALHAARAALNSTGDGS